MLVKRHKSGGSENEVKIELIEIVLAEAELCTELRKNFKLSIELPCCAFIAGCYIAACVKQPFYKRSVAHSDTDNAYALVLNAVYIFIKSHDNSLQLTPVNLYIIRL